jgi:hypothetical protein
MTASIDTEGTDELAPKIVLIVDDDPLILTTMRDGLLEKRPHYKCTPPTYWAH